MKKDKDNINNAFKETTKLALRSWKHRADIPIPFTKKVFKNKGKIPAIIQEVIDNVWRNEELKPLIVEKRAEDNKYTFIINLPAGIVSYKDFKAKEDYFYDAVSGDISIERRGKVVTLTVLEGTLGIKYPYNFDPSLYPKMYLPFPIGYSVNGLIVRDLAKFPYMLIGGLPDYGKSNGIHVLNFALLTGRNNTCFIVTIDFKRSEYATYMDKYGLLVTTEPEAHRVLNLLEKEMERRMDLCARLGEQRIHDIKSNNRPPFIVLEIDEITELQDKDSQLTLGRIMRMGRAYGFCVIPATQRPSARTFRNETFTEVRALCAVRMCYHVSETPDSIMILGNGRGVDIPAISGRGIFKSGVEQIEVQTMYINPKKIPILLKESENYQGRNVDYEYSQESPEEYHIKQLTAQFKQDIQSPKILPPR